MTVTIVNMWINYFVFMNFLKFYFSLVWNKEIFLHLTSMAKLFVIFIIS